MTTRNPSGPTVWNDVGAEDTVGAECPEPERLAALAEGRLGGRDLDEVVRHLGRCESCYEVLASSVKDLEAAGWLPRVEDAGPRSYLPAWFASAAAALIVVAGLLVWLARAPGPRAPGQVAGPVVQTPRAPGAVVPSPPGATVEGGLVSPEAWAALRLLHPSPPWPGSASVGFVPDARAAALRSGIEDAHRILRAEAPPPAAPDASDPWRRVGLVLEASRLALQEPGVPSGGFFDAAWTRNELGFAADRLREAEIADAELPADLLTHGARADAETAQRLLDRIGRLLGRLL